MSSIYINKTYIYSKKNIAGFQLLDEDDKNFEKLLYYDEAIDYIKSLGGKIKNAEVYISNKNYLGKDIYKIKADGKNLKSIMDRDLIFNLNVLYNQREVYYEKYKNLFAKFICIISF